MDMTKTQAAEYLEVSPRILEKYTFQGKLSVSYVQGKNGKEARYSKEELDRLKEERSTPLHRPMTVKADSSEELPPPPPALGILGNPDQLRQFFEAFSPKKRPLLITEIACKLTLRVEEASLISGFSEQDIFKAIHSKELPAKKKGSWRIKRDDLDRWITKMDFGAFKGS